jgi:hypothetical protein
VSTGERLDVELALAKAAVLAADLPAGALAEDARRLEIAVSGLSVLWDGSESDYANIAREMLAGSAERMRLAAQCLAEAVEFLRER